MSKPPPPSRRDGLAFPMDDDDPDRTFIGGDEGSATRMEPNFNFGPEAGSGATEGRGATGAQGTTQGGETTGRGGSSKTQRGSGKLSAEGIVRAAKSQEAAGVSEEVGLIDDDEDLSGRTIDDFRVLRTLGQGGMARVYLAEQVSLRRQVALKVMARDMLAKPDSLERFRSEAMAAAGLSHPNIVQVYTIGEAAGQHYIAMEYVPGRNLRQWVRRTGPLPLAQALKVMRQAASALRAAGEAGIVHRDIKPANLLVSRKGLIKVDDFGLSIAPHVERSSGDLTAVGQTVGTPRYMSPEQVEGRTTDHRSDIYSLGVTFYYLLAGRAPYSGETPVQIALQHLKSEPPSLAAQRPDLPPEVCGLVHRMMAKEAAQRPQGASDVVDDLRRLARQFGASESDESIAVPTTTFASVDEAAEAARRPSLRQRIVSLLGSQAAAVQSPAFLILPLLLCLGVGLLVGVAMRPIDPLTNEGGGIGVQKAESVREQYLQAMFANSPQAFLAVETYWDDPAWTAKARQQRLLMVVRDPRRTTDALDLIEQLRGSTDPTSTNIATVADFVLAVNSRQFPRAEQLERRAELAGESVPSVWQTELANALRVLAEEQRRE